MITMNENKTNNIIKIALNEIKKNGYEQGIKSFIKKFPKHKMELINPQFNQSVDNIVYCLGFQNENCLILQNNFGNTMETLSNIYHKVISQNSDEDYIKFQLERVKNISKKNIELQCLDKKQFPYEDDFFDLIVYENFFENIQNLKDEEINSIIFEIIRILKPSGCFYFIEKKLNKKIETMLNKSGLKIKQYWSMQNNSIPSFSGKNDDYVGLKWYMNNISIFLSTKKISLKKKMALFTMKINSKQLIHIFKEKFIPSTIYCCYKDKIPLSVTDFIEQETGFKHFVVQSRPKKIIFILLNRNGSSQKIVNFKRYGYDFPTKIINVDRKFSEMRNPRGRLWMEDWFQGRTINVKKYDEIKLVIEWLIDFQNNTKQEIRTDIEIEYEINKLKNKICDNLELDTTKCLVWLEDYKIFLKNNKFFTTAVHGDFWINNIIYDSKLSKINVIDWEKYVDRGSPLYDFMYFLTNLITKTKESPLDLQIFQKFINEKTKEYNLLVKIKPIIDTYFKCNVNFLMLFRIEIIKRILAPPFGSSILNKKNKNIQLEMLRMLNEKKTLFI